MVVKWKLDVSKRPPYMFTVVRNVDVAQVCNIGIGSKEFQKSIAKELDAIKNIVKNLVGTYSVLYIISITPNILILN